MVSCIYEMLYQPKQHTYLASYRTAGIFGGIKFGELLIFCGQQVLIWQIGRHMSLSMHTVNENGRLNLSKW